MLGEGARAEDLTQLRHALGLDLSLPVQYEHYLTGVLRGNLGESFRYQRPVTKVILEHYPATLELAFIALLVCAAIGISAGILAAHKRGQPADRAVSVLTLFGLSVPNFALGPVLILVFSVIFGWLPVSGRGGISHIVLPAITLGAALAAILTRMVRSSMIEELSSDYVRTARAKGLSESAVLFRHAFRNALIPILTILGLQFGTLLAGTIVTETIFSWPGIGRLAVTRHPSPRLSAAPRLHSPNRHLLRSSKSPNRFRLRPGRPKGALRMKSLRQFWRQSPLARWGLVITLLLALSAL